MACRRVSRIELGNPRELPGLEKTVGNRRLIDEMARRKKPSNTGVSNAIQEWGRRYDASEPAQKKCASNGTWRGSRCKS
jgi:hypothetical protein